MGNYKNSMSNISSTESPSQQIMRITLTGAAVAGAGALLNVYVPAFHKPTQWLHGKLECCNGQLSKLPVAKHIFADNPLTCHSSLTEFLAINIMETPFIAGSMVSLGALMKASGIKPDRFKHSSMPSNDTPIHL